MTAILDFELCAGKNKDFGLQDVGNYWKYVGDYSEGITFENSVDNRTELERETDRKAESDHFLYMFAVTKEKKAVRDGDYQALHFLNYMKGLI